MSTTDNFHTVPSRGHASRRGYARLDALLADCATLYNAALQHRRDAYRYTGESVSYYDQCQQLTALRQDDPHWNSIHLGIARGVIKRVDRTYAASFRRVKAGDTPGFPRFQPRSRYKTIEIPERAHSVLKWAKNNKDIVVRIKGLPTIRFRPHQDVPDLKAAKSLLITRRTNSIDVVIQLAHQPEPLPATGAITALDPGVAQRLTSPDGVTAERLQRDNAKQLQQEISRFKERALTDGRAYWAPVITRWHTHATTGSSKQRFYLAWESGKVPARLLRLSAKLAKTRHKDQVRARNETHLVTPELVRQHDVIGIEDTNLLNMTHSAAGTLEEPGTNVAAKAGLNRAILDQNIGQLYNQLSYKAAWAGRTLIRVPAAHTTRTCVNCGTINERPSADRVYRCAVCHHEADQDRNAARNILNATLQAIVLDSSQPSAEHVVELNAPDGFPTRRAPPRPAHENAYSLLGAI